MRVVGVVFLSVLLGGCGAPDPASGAGEAADAAAAPDLLAPPDETPLEVRFLGVGGFLLRRGGDAILTAPLYTNPSLVETSAAGSIASRPDLVARFTAGLPLADVRAVLVGHAHYDHLMDVPTVLPQLAPGALVYGNQTMRHILAAFAPDRAARCSSPAPAVTVAREQVVALDDPQADRVDARLCGGSGGGEWVRVPGANVRIRALCSEHPDQLPFFHFGEGSVDQDLCDPPTKGEDWREGTTLAYVIDFLDGEVPAYRVYYQDAPTNAPIGHIPADILAEKRVDVALLCVGSFERVAEQPGAILRALGPRYAISGHWEDFFQTQDQPLQPIPFMDLARYRAVADALMSAPSEPPLAVDGAPSPERHFVPNPGTRFTIARRTE